MSPLILGALAAISLSQVDAEQVKAPTSETLVKEAFAKAKRENKIAMIVFHASW